MIKKEDILAFIRQNRNYLKERQFQRDVDIAREKYLKSYVKSQIINEAVYVE